jgi:hypothetical protein
VGVAQRPKASGCGPEYRGFKSLHPPQQNLKNQKSKVKNPLFFPTRAGIF